MNMLVTFYAQNADGQRLVGVGLTDQMIEHLKDKKMILEEGEKSNLDTDVLVVYGPTLNELMQQVKKVVPQEKMDVRIL